MAVELRTLVSELEEVVDWHTLGVHLRVPKYRLDMIEQKCGSQPDRCKTELLEFWLKNKALPGQEWQMVVDALKCMPQHAGLAERKKYIAPDSELETPPNGWCPGRCRSGFRLKKSWFVLLLLSCLLVAVTLSHKVLSLFSNIGELLRGQAVVVA